MTDSLYYANLPPHIKRSIKLAWLKYLKKGTPDQVGVDLERELELRRL